MWDVVRQVNFQNFKFVTQGGSAFCPFPRQIPLQHRYNQCLSTFLTARERSVTMRKAQRQDSKGRIQVEPRKQSDEGKKVHFPRPSRLAQRFKHDKRHHKVA
jgi:hypothetical protein